MQKVRYETCEQYVARRLSEGWKITKQEGFNVVLQSPEGLIRPVDLRYDTEEQTQYNTNTAIYASYPFQGQRLTISNRTVSKLGFWLKKYGSIAGDVTFEIHKVSDDSVIVSKVWGDASALTTSYVYREVTFDTPVLINEEVRILVGFSGGNFLNYVVAGEQTPSVKENELTSSYWYGDGWHDFEAYDFAYIYTYTTAQNYERSGTALLGLAPSGSRVNALTRSDSSLLGLLSTGARVEALTRVDTGLLGLKSTASRTTALTRAKTAILGMMASGTKSASVQMGASLLGLKTIGTRVLSLIREALHD